MGQGDYTHPSYLTRQQIGLGKNTAAANTQSIYKVFPASNIRFRNFSAVVTSAGTSTGASIIILNGTATAGSIVLGTATVGSFGTTGDLNFTLTQGVAIGVKTGTDASLVCDTIGEAYIDPASSWTGQN